MSPTEKGPRSRDLGPFDASVAQLRAHFDLLEAAVTEPTPRAPEHDPVVERTLDMAEPESVPEAAPDQPEEAEPELEWRAW